MPYKPEKESHTQLPLQNFSGRVPEIFYREEPADMFQNFNIKRPESSAGRKRELIYPLPLDLSGNDFPVAGVLRRVFLIKGVIGKLNHAAGALPGTGGLYIISHRHTVALPIVTGRTALKQDIDQNVQLAGGTVLQSSQAFSEAVCPQGFPKYPGAKASCPIGAIQAVIGSSKYKFSYYNETNYM